MNKERSRCWVFTSFDVSESFEETLAQLGSTQCVYGREVCPSSGREHFQGLLQFKNARKFSVLRKKLGSVHIEVAKWSLETNEKYCKKDGDFKEFGEKPKQGQRNDKSTLVDLVQDGVSIVDMVRDGSIKNINQLKFANSLYTLLTPTARPRDKLKVIWIIGPSGSGKTRYCVNNHPDAYVKTGSTKWFDGYSGQDVVIIDDITNEFSFVDLLDLLDKSKTPRVDIKGSSFPFVATTVQITSVKHPAWIYRHREAELMRRIDEVMDLGCDLDLSGLRINIPQNNIPVDIEDQENAPYLQERQQG